MNPITCFFVIMSHLFFILFLYPPYSEASFSLSPQVVEQLGERVWRNECGGSIQGLTHWNANEEFGSFGIAHFIWYPKGVQAPFEEMFPSLLSFLQQQGVQIPQWLLEVKHCPWNNHAHFLSAFDSSEMRELREILFATRKLQAYFIARRVESLLPKMIKDLSQNDRDRVVASFTLLAKDPRGLYAMVDYTNFKGEGLISTESYQGMRWGLLQVLLLLNPQSSTLVEDFVASAKYLLSLRVKNAPKEREEERWLKGWLNRLDSYLVR